MSGGEPRQRGALRYAKPALAHSDLIERLVDRGLIVTDRQRTLRYLRHIGYYRFSPYLIPFRLEPSGEALRPGTTFDQVLDLYVFDRQLRLLVMDGVERIEVAVRSSLTDCMATTYDDPFWYTDPRHFKDTGRHAGLLSEIEKACGRHLGGRAEAPQGTYAHVSALEHYLTTYGEPELPPSWLMVEMLTLGQLDGLIRNLKRNSDVTGVSRPIGLNGPILQSWLRVYVRLRNICAHHGRLWNVGLGVYPALPRAPSVPWLGRPEVLTEQPNRRKRLYPALVSIQSVLTTVSPRSSWAARLNALLFDHPGVPLRGMGIPEDWRTDPFWSECTHRGGLKF